MARLEVLSHRPFQTVVNTITEERGLLLSKGVLRYVTVSLDGEEDEPAWVSVAVGKSGNKAVLAEGWIRTGRLSGDSFGVRWQGELPVDRSTVLILTHYSFVSVQPIVNLRWFVG